jgi:hypothetical protein
MTAPTGFDYTHSLLPAADASIIPMKGGGSEATDFYTKFVEILNLDGYFISIKDSNVTLTSRELTRFYRKTQSEKDKDEAERLATLRAKQAEKSAKDAAAKKAVEDAAAARKEANDARAREEALKVKLQIAEATAKGLTSGLSGKTAAIGGGRILGRGLSKRKLNASVE